MEKRRRMLRQWKKDFNPRTRVGYDRAHCPACGLIGSHAVPNIPLGYQTR